MKGSDFFNFISDIHSVDGFKSIKEGLVYDLFFLRMENIRTDALNIFLNAYTVKRYSVWICEKIKVNDAHGDRFGSKSEMGTERRHKQSVSGSQLVVGSICFVFKYSIYNIGKGIVKIYIL